VQYALYGGYNNTGCNSLNLRLPRQRIIAAHDRHLHGTESRSGVEPVSIGEMEQAREDMSHAEEHVPTDAFRDR